MYRVHLVVRGYRVWLVPLVSREHQAGQDLVDLQAKMETKDPQVTWLVEQYTVNTVYPEILVVFKFGGLAQN